MSDEGDIGRVLEERPDLRNALETIVTIDERTETWTFEDVPIDSGRFGELVSSGIVESVGDEYRIADLDATKAALSDDSSQAGRTTAPELSLSEVRWPVVDRVTVVALALALGFVALVRAHPLQKIYRDGNVVLSGNDPYYYRYWVERVLAESDTVFNLDALATLPDGVTKGEPLLVATLWWLSELLGNGGAIVGDVMAWYPIVAAVITGLFVYLLAVTVTGDRRVGLAAVLLFAIVPGHALRTSLGYADHHAFDYIWLALTALSLTVLADVDRESLTVPRTWLASLGLGIGIAGQTLSWEAAPLLIAAAGLGVVAIAIAAVDSGRSPLVLGGPVLLGLAVAAGLAGFGHVVVGWHTARVAFAPAIVLVGSAVVICVAAAVHRTTSDVRHLIGADLILFVLGIVIFRDVRPDDWTALTSSTERLTAERNIAETVGLFDPNSLGVLLLLGFTLVIALPAMVLGVQRARSNRRWAVPTAYVWYFLGLSALSVRFVGELAPILAVFAGVGFVRLAAWIDAIEPLADRSPRDSLSTLSVPDRRRLTTLAVLFLLVGSLGMVQVPVKTSQLTIEDSTYQSAAYIANHSAAQNESYPDNYVLSQWGRNRVYNYFVSGESESYGYARQHHAEFLRSSDADQWYNQFDNRVGYVVIDRRVNSTAGTAHAQLANDFGTQTPESDGLAHFRPIYVTPDSEKITYQVVPGALVKGQAPNNGTVALGTNVTLSERTFTYQRETTANASGNFTVRVANPGTYAVKTANGTRDVTVPTAAVRNGTSVRVEND